MKKIALLAAAAPVAGMVASALTNQASAAKPEKPPAMLAPAPRPAARPGFDPAAQLRLRSMLW